MGLASIALRPLRGDLFQIDSVHPDLFMVRQIRHYLHVKIKVSVLFAPTFPLFQGVRRLQSEREQAYTQNEVLGGSSRIRLHFDPDDSAAL